MRTFLGWILAAALAGCASSGGVAADIDSQVSPQARFGNYKTYTWLAKPEYVSAEAAQFIVDAVDAQLRQRGWTQAEQGDVGVRVQVATVNKQTIENTYTPAGGGYGMMASYGNTTTRAVSYREGTLAIDLFDTAAKQGVWRATASGALPPSKAQTRQMVDDAIKAMFAELPSGP